MRPLSKKTLKEPTPSKPGPSLTLLYSMGSRIAGFIFVPSHQLVSISLLLLEITASMARKCILPTPWPDLFL